MSVEDDVKHWLSCQPGDVKKNFKVVSYKDTGDLIRIDKIVPKVFTPRLPMWPSEGENTSVSRVCASDTIMGCCYGYKLVQILSDFQGGYRNKTEWFEPYNGGYCISRLDYDMAVFPNEELVKAGPKNNEHWLVNFNKDHASFNPEPIGEIFISEVRYISGGNKKAPYPVINFIVKIDIDEGVKFAKDIHLQKGCWVISYTPGIKDGNSFEDKGVESDDNYTVTALGSGEYATKKKMTCAMLSYNKPVIASW